MEQQQQQEKKRNRISGFFRSLFQSNNNNKSGGNKAEKVDFGVEKTETLTHFQRPKAPRNKRPNNNNGSRKFSRKISDIEEETEQQESEEKHVVIKPAGPLMTIAELKLLKQKKEEKDESQQQQELEPEQDDVKQVAPLLPIAELKLLKQKKEENEIKKVDLRLNSHSKEETPSTITEERKKKAKSLDENAKRRPQNNHQTDVKQPRCQSLDLSKQKNKYKENASNYTDFINNSILSSK